MGNGWFETVAEAQRRARKRLPWSVYGALVAGTEKGVTLEDNQAAFAQLGFAPHVAGLQHERERWLDQQLADLDEEEIAELSRAVEVIDRIDNR